MWAWGILASPVLESKPQPQTSIWSTISLLITTNPARFLVVDWVHFGCLSRSGKVGCRGQCGTLGWRMRYQPFPAAAGYGWTPEHQHRPAFFWVAYLPACVTLGISGRISGVESANFSFRTNSPTTRPGDMTKDLRKGNSLILSAMRASTHAGTKQGVESVHVSSEAQ